MPIKGLSDIRRYSRRGIIRLGEKRETQNGKEYPAKLDYFLLDPEDKDDIPRLRSIYGDKPRRIEIAFASNSPDEIFDNHYKLYTASGLQCKGTGETATRLSANGMVDVHCPGPEECEFSMSKGVRGKPGCKRLGTLSFFLTKWDRFFIWQIRTSSWNSIVNLNSALELLLRITNGRIAFVPVELILKPQQSQVDGKKVIIYVIDLVIPVGLSNIGALRSLIPDNSVAMPALPLLGEEDIPDDQYPLDQITVPAEAPEVAVEPEPAPTDDVAIDVEYDDAPPMDAAPPSAPPSTKPTKDQYESIPGFDKLPAFRARGAITQALNEGWSIERMTSFVQAFNQKKSESPI